MERSESGAPIYRHQQRQSDFEYAIGDAETIERISEHIEKHIGRVATVYHEIISDLIHIDVHVVEPTETRNWFTLVTSGMSDRPMPAPSEHADLKYSELLICLPPEWPMRESDWEQEENYWPIRALKYLARFPHEYQTWLWASHSVPNGDPPQPFAPNTEMSGVVLLPPVTVAGGFLRLEINKDKTVHFHAVVPLYSEELDLKLRVGLDSLLDGFDRFGVSEILDPKRSTVVSTKKSWFPFWRKN